MAKRDDLTSADRGRRGSVRTWIGPKVRIEAAVLFDDVDDVLNVALRCGAGPYLGEGCEFIPNRPVSFVPLISPLDQAGPGTLHGNQTRARYGCDGGLNTRPRHQIRQVGNASIRIVPIRM